MKTEVHQGDCLDILKTLQSNQIDLIYLDPPFFTQKIQKLGTRDRKKAFSFNDIWRSTTAYADFLFERLKEMHRVLAASGSIFFHCDSNASAMGRLILDEIFGRDMFRAEIIWHYRRWSNSQRTLLSSHQNIYFYSKTDEYKYNQILQDYSFSTNVDQILQKRRRDKFGKAIYARDQQGTLVSNGEKKGVPMSDVWDIPFLNPKAKERVGYPTQKPILLLERIIEIASDEGDSVLDPFCGSGTTMVAADLLGRKGIGIDISPQAIELTRQRLNQPTRTESHLLLAGRESYQTADREALAMLSGLDIIPVQRNKGIDAFLRAGLDAPIPIRVQRPCETLLDAATALRKAAQSKQIAIMILVATSEGLGLNLNQLFPDVVVVDCVANAIDKAIKNVCRENEYQKEQVKHRGHLLRTHTGKQ